MSYSWALLAENWDTLTDAQKEALFMDTNYAKPTIQELEALGKPFKVASYGASPLKVKTVVEGVPKPRLVLPKTLFGSDFDTINSMTATVSETGNGKVRFIFTTDLVTYYTFNFGMFDFVPVSSLDAATVLSEGINATGLGTLTATEFSKIFTGIDEIGIGFALEKDLLAESAAVDNLVMNVDMIGSWKKAVHTTDYDYEYASNKVLRVTLLTDGTYKINYPT